MPLVTQKWIRKKISKQWYLQLWEQYSPCLTYVTLWSVFRMGEVDEGDVGSADEEGEEPDDEHHQQRVPCRQAGSQRVEDAHVPQ